MIHFAHPDYWPLIALLLVFGVVASLLRLPKLGWPYALLQFLALSAFSLALLAPYREELISSRNAIALIDVSDSSDADRMNELLGKLEAYTRAGISLRLKPFSTSVADAELPSSQNFEKLAQSQSSLGTGETNLEVALRQAASLGSGNLLLLSDGFETQGDAERVLAGSAAVQRIFPLLPADAAARGTQFSISQVFAPLTVEAKKSVEIQIGLSNKLAAGQRGKLTVTQNGKELSSSSVSLGPREEKLVTVSSDASIEGLSEITAVLTPDQPSLAPSSETIFLSGEKRDRVLLVSGAPDDERYLAQVLRDQAYDLETIVDRGNGVDLPDLSRFSTLIFNNLPRSSLTNSALQAVPNYVRSGGGFLMLGGAQSFGLGGYRDTEIEKILPVELLPPQTEKKRLNVAVEIVIDKSRSMASDDKLEFAKDAARELIKSLKDEDYAGVIGFDATPFIVVKLGLLSETRSQAIARVDRLFPAGRTNLFPAMDEARRSLDRVNAGRKHMIVLTDGIIPDAGPIYTELVRQMRLMGITVSTVLLGDEMDPMLKTMAELGGGAFYRTNDPRSLPKIFVSDMKVASGEQTLKESTDFEVMTASHEPVSTTLRDFPNLRGYVETREKPAATTELLVRGDKHDDPLLASWKVSQGKAIAFTSDATSRWANRWVSWNKFAQFWTEVLDALRPVDKNEGSKIRFDLTHVVDRGRLNLDLSIFSENTSGAITLALTLPDKSSLVLPFSEKAKGHYQSQFEHPIAGTYQAKIKVGSVELPTVAFNLPGRLFGEKKGQGFNVPLLTKLAQATGGKINPSPEELVENPVAGKVRQDFSMWLLIVAILLFAGQIYWREMRT